MLTYRSGEGIEGFPDQYQGAAFFADYFNDQIQYLLPEDNGSYTRHVFGSGYSTLVDGAVGADGSITLLTYSGVMYNVRFGVGHLYC